MLKTLFLLFSLYCIIVFCSCQKEADLSINPPEVDTSNVPPGDSYLPLTKGTFWIYADSGFANSNDTVTVVGEDTTINTITYQSVHNKSAIEDDTVFYGIQAHNYYLYGQQNGFQITMLILNDTTSVGNGWEYDMGDVNGLPGKGIGKIIEKDITDTVKGKVYAHVIHVKYMLEYNLLGSFTDFGDYDFYFAKGIGLINIISAVSTTAGGVPSINSKQELINYSIK